MDETHSGEFVFLPASDQSLLIQTGDRITPEASREVARLVRMLSLHPIAGMRDMNPAYCSLLVKFDPLQISRDRLEANLRSLMEHTRDADLPPTRDIEIPVVYGGEFGPDLEDVAAHHGITTGEVVRIHSEAEYTVCFLGFVPGFAYLGGLSETIATPRLASPRKRVPAGSVAIGGNQTAVYPLPTPGGWRLLGRTPLTMFRADRDPASLLTIGDRVRFVSIPAGQFEELERAHQ